MSEVIFADALVCKHCGKIVERGIFNVLEHHKNCAANFDKFEYVYDAEYEIIEPKQIENKSATE